MNELESDAELLTEIYVELLSEFKYFISDEDDDIIYGEENYSLYNIEYEELSEKRMAFEPKIREIRVHHTQLWQELLHNIFPAVKI